MAEQEVERLIKSRERVRGFGEVFTPAWLVRKMCDVVDDACRDPEARFLEPACGDGNFLVEILRRKLETVRARYRKKRARYEAVAFVAMASLYGIELLEDNVARCRERLLEEWRRAYPFRKPGPHHEALLAALQAVLSRNILTGDTLKRQYLNGAPLVFPEWTLKGDALTVRTYSLDALYAARKGDDLFTRILVPLSETTFAPYWDCVPPEGANYEV